MISFFPVPYPDELFYSICARYADRIGFSVFRSAALHIFGKEIRSVNIYFPSQIPDFIERLPPNDLCTFDYIVNNHTVIPFYSVFVSSEDALNIKSALKNN